MANSVRIVASGKGFRIDFLTANEVIHVWYSHDLPNLNTTVMLWILDGTLCIG